MADQITRGPFDPNPTPEQTPQQPTTPLGPAPPAPIVFDGPFASQPPDPLRDQLTARPAERAARLRDLSRRTGLPVPIVDRNFDVLDARDRGLRYDVAGVRQRSPELARWLERNGEIAPAAADDLPTLEAQSRSIDILGKLKQGWEQAEAFTGAFVEWYGDLVGSDKIEDYGRGVRERNAAQAAAYGPTLSFSQVDDAQSFSKWLSEGFAQNTPQLALSIGSATTGATIGAAFFGVGAVPGAVLGAVIGAIPSVVMGIGETQSEIKAIDPHASAPGAVFLGGSAVAALDTVLPQKVGSKLVRVFGFDFAEAAAQKALLSSVKPAFFRGTLREGVTGYATEGVTEALQAAITQTMAALGTGTTVDWSKVATQMFEEGLLGGFIGGGIAAGTNVATFRRELRNHAIAEQNMHATEALAASVQASKLAQRSPEAAADAIQSQADAAGVSTFYLPIDTFTEYWQTKGDNPDARADELTGRPGSLEAARTAGQRHLAVPASTFATKIAGGADQAHFAFWKKNFTLDPALMTVEESQAAVDELMAAAPTPEAAAAQPLPSIVQVAARILEQAAAAGASRKEAEQWAVLWSHRYQTRAFLLGIDPLELWQKDPLTIITTDATGRSITDARPARSTERADLAPSRVPQKGETTAERRTRVQAHTAALAQIVVDHAVKVDATVDTARLRQELDYRLELQRENRNADSESGRGQDLLRAIGGYGGISPVYGEAGKAVVGTGEVKHLIESRDKKDTHSGGRKLRKDEIGPDTWNGIAGVFTTEGGNTPEYMLRQLQQDARFQQLESLSDLFAAIEDAIAARPDAADELPGTDELHTLGIDLDAAWWVDSWLTADPSADATATQDDVVDELPPGAPDDEGFEFNQELDPEKLERAIALYRERGTGRSPVRMARALADAGIKLPSRTTAEREASNALVDELLEREAALPGDEFFQLKPETTPPGYKAIEGDLDPAQAAKLRADTVLKLLEKFEQLPTIAEMTEIAQAGAVKKGWYEEARNAIALVFGDVDSVRFTALLAALSPRKAVEENLLIATRMWVAWTAAGRPQSPARIERLLKKAAKGFLPSVLPNTILALTNPEGLRTALSGAKVSSFESNLMGDLFQATLDVWMLIYAGITDERFLGGSEKSATTGLANKAPGYMAFEAATRKAARKLTKDTGVKWEAAHVQETIWSWAKTVYELSDKAGVSAEEFVKNGGVTDAAILATPDFATLLTRDATVREILEGAGYGPVLRSLETRARRAARQRDAAAGNRGAFARVTPAQLRAARRIDNVKRERAQAAADEAAEKRRVKGAELRAQARKTKRRPRDDGGGEYYQRTKMPATVDTAPGTYATQTVLEPTGERQVPRRLTDADAVAAAAASLARGAVERFDAFVVDAKGKPLAIVGSFKGRVDQTSVHPDVILAEAIRLEGAAGVWMVHNHPSGDPTLSSPDQTLHAQTRDRFGSSGIKVLGMMAVGYNGAYQVQYEDDSIDAGYAKPDLPTTTVPIVERTFAAHAKLGGRIMGPVDAVREVPRLAGGEFGVVFLDTRYMPLGFLPMDAVGAGHLRDDGRLPELLRAASIANASLAVMHAPPGTAGPLTAVTHAANVARALKLQGIDTLDIVLPHPQTGQPTTVTQMNGGAPMNIEGEFFQLSPLEGFTSRVVRAVTESKQLKATGAQWKATIKNAGVDLEEFRALALETLEDGTTYTRDQLVEVVNANAVDVQVVTMTEDKVSGQKIQLRADALYEEELRRTMEDLGLEDVGGGAYIDVEEETDDVDREDGNETWAVVMRGNDGSIIQDDMVDSEEAANQLRDQWQEQLDSKDEAERRELAAQRIPNYDEFYRQAEDELNDLAAGDRVHYPARQWPRLHVPGADPGTYREVFLTAPNARIYEGFVDGQHDPVHTADESVLLKRFTHYRQLWRAVLANDQVLLDATIALGLSGLRAAPPTPRRLAMIAALEKLQAIPVADLDWVERPTWGDGHGSYDSIENPIVRLRFDTRTSADGTTTLFLQEVQPPGEEEFARMPALFQKHWRALAFKWALREAAVKGYQRLAWTGGEVQVERYSLRQVADRIEYYPATKQLAAYKDSNSGPDGSQVFRQHDVTPEDLAKYIGKEAAARLLATVPVRHHEPVYRVEYRDDDSRQYPWLLFRDDKLQDRFPTERLANANANLNRSANKLHADRQGGIHRIEGDDLEIGGMGLERLYNVDYRNTVNGLVKKTGAKVATTTVPNAERLEWVYSGPAFTANELIAFAEKDRTDLKPGSVGERNGRELGRPLGAALAMQAKDVGQAIKRGESFTEAMAQNGSAGLAEWLGGTLTQESRPASVPAIEITITPAVREQFTHDQVLFADQQGRVQGSFRPSSKTIRLVAGASDLSTFLHESGHAFLEELLTDALTVPEGHRLRQDAGTALRWLGFQGSLEEWQQLSVDARRDMQEQWADGFLTYLHEGRAPVAELQSLFSRFRGWLVQVYRTVTGLKVEVPADVRAVMDRLVASEEAITLAERQASVSPLFSDAATMGVDELTFAAYRAQMQAAGDEARRDIDAQVMADWRREQTAEWRTEAEGVRREVIAELGSEPVYVAQSVIRTGKLPDGTTPAFGTGEPMKLSKDIIVVQFGQEMLGRLPRPYLYTVTGGLDPGVVAQLTGFPTASAMLEALARAPKFESVVRQETDRRMRDRHGDRLLDGISLQEAAAAAVSDQRRQVIGAEMRALTSAMSDAVLPRTDVVRAAAEASVARMRYRDVKPHHYRAAAARASQQAFQRLAANDRRGAIQAKQVELVQLEYYRAARQAVERGEKIERRMRQFDTSSGLRGRMGKAGVLEQIDAILERYEWRRATNKQLDRRLSLRQFVAKLQNDGLPIEIPEDVLDDARQVNWRELTVDELEGVADAVESLAHLGRLKDKLLKAARERSLAAAVLELVSSIQQHNKARPQGHETRLASQRFAKGVRGYFAEHRKIASLAYEMDGFVDGGPMWEYIIRPINDAADQEAVRNQLAAKALIDLFNTAYKGGEQAALYRPVFRPELGLPATNPRASLSKQAVLMMAIHQGNETNRQRLRDGHGWTQRQVDQVLSAHLDKRDWDFVQGVIDHLESYWPESSEKQKRVTGVAPKKVEATPIFTRFGEYRGGYAPLKYEGELSSKQDRYQASNTAKLAEAAAAVRATTRRNHLKERAEGNVVAPLRLDFGVIFEHVSEVIHDLTHHEMLIDLGRLLGHEDVQQAILDTHGPEVRDQFNLAMKAIAIGDEPGRGWRERLLGHIRTGSTVAAMAWSASTALLQPFGITQSFQRVGYKWVVKGSWRWLSDPFAMRRTVQDVHAKSAFMRTRALTMNREVNEIRNRIAMNDGRLYGFFDGVVRKGTADKASLQAIADTFFVGITGMQMLVDVPTWLGAYEKAVAGGNDEATAIALADQMVRDSQGSGEPAYLAEVQRGPASKKLFTNFYSFFSTTVNLWIPAKRRAELTPAGIARLASDYLLLLVLPAVGSYILREGLRGEFGDDDDEFWTRMAGEVAGYHLSTLWLVREFSGVLAGGFGYEGPAGLRPIAQTSKALRDVGEAVWEWDPEKITARSAKTIATAAGAWLHLPTTQALRTIEGIAAILDGQTQNPAAVLLGPPRED